MSEQALTKNEIALHLVIKDVYSVHDPFLHVMTPANRAEVVKALDAAGFRQLPAEAVLVEGKLPEATIENLFGGDHLFAVVRDDNGLVCNWEVTQDSIDNARRCARDALAIANRIEEYLESEEHTAKVLQERRDKLAAEFTNNSERPNYATIGRTAQRAIDHIIELEDKLGAKS